MGSTDCSVDEASGAGSSESPGTARWALESGEWYGLGAALVADDSGYLGGCCAISWIAEGDAAYEWLAWADCVDAVLG